MKIILKIMKLVVKAFTSVDSYSFIALVGSATKIPVSLQKLIKNKLRGHDIIYSLDLMTR